MVLEEKTKKVDTPTTKEMLIFFLQQLDPKYRYPAYMAAKLGKHEQNICQILTAMVLRGEAVKTKLGFSKKTQYSLAPDFLARKNLAEQEAEAELKLQQEAKAKYQKPTDELKTELAPAAIKKIAEKEADEVFENAFF